MSSFEALRHSESIYAEHRKLKIYSITAGLAVISFLVLRLLLGLLIQYVQPLQLLVQGNYSFYLSLLSLFTVFSIGLPFFLVFLVTRQVSKVEILPAGKANNLADMILLIVAGFAACIAASLISAYFSAYIKDIFNIEFQFSSDPAPKTPIDIILYLLAYAVTPALMEEFALRGVVMQPLRKYGDWFAILMSSLVFALMHGNMTQVPFAFIAGISIGFAVIKSGTLWTGIIIHFLNNASYVAQSIFLESSRGDSNSAWLLIYLFYALVLLVGGACALAYFNRVQKRERTRYQQMYPFSLPPKNFPLLYKNPMFQNRNSVGKYVSTLPMLAAIVIMIVQTLSSITFLS